MNSINQKHLKLCCWLYERLSNITCCWRYLWRLCPSLAGLRSSESSDPWSGPSLTEAQIKHWQAAAHPLLPSGVRAQGPVEAQQPSYRSSAGRRWCTCACPGTWLGRFIRTLLHVYQLSCKVSTLYKEDWDQKCQMFHFLTTLATQIHEVSDNFQHCPRFPLDFTFPSPLPALLALSPAGKAARQTWRGRNFKAHVRSVHLFDVYHSKLRCSRLIQKKSTFLKFITL